MQSAAPDTDALSRINRYTRREFTADELYVFSVRACDDLTDRDYERFTADCLAALAPMFLGRTMLCDHDWEAKKQTARVFNAEVVTEGESHYLRLDCYMLRSEETKATTDRIDAGILKEVSVGCAISRVTCSICGEAYYGCQHQKGVEYDGAVCVAELSEPTDAYELSFVAVPAQPKAGVLKGKTPGNHMSMDDLETAKAQIALEKIRFGG